MTRIIIPTLRANTFAIDTTTEPTLAISYVMQYYVSVPKSLTEMFEEEGISLQYQIAKYASDIASLAAASQVDIERVLRRLFPTDRINVSVESELVDSKAGQKGSDYTIHDYSLSYSITIIRNGIVHNWNQNVIINEDGTLDFSTKGR